MSLPNHFLLEGIDRVGKNKLIQGIQDRLGFHQVLHYQRPQLLGFYTEQGSETDALRRHQEASFQSMFELVCGVPSIKLIFNRAHLGECVYAPMYRGYSGDYVFELEQRFNVRRLQHVRLVLLLEDFAVSRHFVDDGLSLGGTDKRRDEQRLFRMAFETSSIEDKRLVCVTDQQTGQFREFQSILNDVLA